MNNMTAAGPNHPRDTPRVEAPRKQEYPDGPRINFPLAVIGQMLPALFPFDALEFGLDIARQFGDIAHYQLGPLHVYQLSHPGPGRSWPGTARSWWSKPCAWVVRGRRNPRHRLGMRLERRNT